MVDPLPVDQAKPSVKRWNGVVYEFSIAPDDTAQHWTYLRKRSAPKPTETRLRRVVTTMRKDLAEHLHHIAEYKLIVEVSEPDVFTPTHRPRVHAHGLVKFRDVIEFYTEACDYLQDRYTMTVNPLREEYWKDYCAKQKELMEPKLQREYVIGNNDHLEMAILRSVPTAPPSPPAMRGRERKREIAPRQQGAPAFEPKSSVIPPRNSPIITVFGAGKNIVW